MAEERQLPNEIKINNISITKRSGDSILQVIPGPEVGGVWEELFINMTIRESIFNNGVSGVLKIREPGIILDKFNMVGDEIVTIDMETPDIPEASKTLKFCVTNVVFSGDEAAEELIGPGARANAYWTIEFGSCETLFLGHVDINSSLFSGFDVEDGVIGEQKDKHFIGPIASEEEDRLVESELQKTGRGIGDFIGLVGDIFGGEEDDGNFPKKGLINHIAEKFFDPGATPFSMSTNKMTIEPTHNNVVIPLDTKPLYPWKKRGVKPSIIQLVNYVAENSVTVDTKGVNYVFYADLDGWHFRSIRDIIQKSETDFFGIDLEKPRQYFITDVDFPEDEWKSGHPRIRSFRVAREYDHMRLFSMGAYSSRCYFYEPKNGVGYDSFVDSPQVKELGSKSYNYLNPSNEWGGMDEGGQVEKYKLIRNSWYEHLESTKKEITDDGIYGWFGGEYNSPVFSYPATIPTGPRTDSYSWQTQFDQTELKAKTLYKIHSIPYEECPEEEPYCKPDIKHLLGSMKPRFDNFYAKKKKWDIYENVVCCAIEENEKEDDDIEKYAFYAVIESAEPIYYEDNENEEQEGEEENDNETSRGPDMSNSSLDDEGGKLQKFRSNMYEYRFREIEISGYVNEEFLNPGGEEGENEENEGGNENGEEGATGNVEILYFNDRETYPEHEQYELSDRNPGSEHHYAKRGVYATIVPDGISGVSYNINEYLNMGVRFNEDASSVYNFFVGPGVNVAGANSDADLDLSEMNDYPEGNRMMPVGGYVRSQTDPCVGEFHFHKHIVKMYAIPDWLNSQKGLIEGAEMEGGESEEDEETREEDPCYRDCDCNDGQEEGTTLCDDIDAELDGEDEQSNEDAIQQSGGYDNLKYYCHTDTTKVGSEDEETEEGVCKKTPKCDNNFIKQQKTLKDSKNTIYVFDVQNAHDGLCSCIEEPF